MKKGIGIVLKKKAKILLQLRDNKKEIANPNKWGLPGGLIEKGETPEQAAIREIKEELGINIDKKKLKLIHKTKSNTFFEYPFEDKNSKLKINEGQDMKLFSKKEILNLQNTASGLKKSVKDYFD